MMRPNYLNKMGKANAIAQVRLDETMRQRQAESRRAEESKAFSLLMLIALTLIGMSVVGYVLYDILTRVRGVI